MNGADGTAEFGSRLKCQFDPAWIDWLGHHAEGLDRFRSVDVPDLPPDRYSTAALQAAEHALHQSFQCVSDALLHHEVLDRFARYLGEVLVQSIHGQWVNDPFPGPAARPAVRFPYTDIRVAVREQVVLSLVHAHWRPLGGRSRPPVHAVRQVVGIRTPHPVARNLRAWMPPRTSRSSRRTWHHRRGHQGIGAYE